MFLSIVHQNPLFLYLVPPFAMVGRVWFGCHYFGDTIGGVIIGAGYMYLIFYVYFDVLNLK